MDCIGNDLSTQKAEVGPNLNFHSAYAHVSSQLRDDAERGGKQPPSSRCDRNNNLSVVLRLLSLETARADAAEARLARDNEAILTRVQSIREVYARTQAELVGVKAELEMYKIQLDLAHKEIRRAQIIVNEADKARAEAEERCARDRENIRELVLQRAINEAREEGRREGWTLGLERGRWDVRAMQNHRRSGNADGTMVKQSETCQSPVPVRLSSTLPSRVFPDTQANIRSPLSSALPIPLPTTNRVDASHRRDSKRRSFKHDSPCQGYHRSSNPIRMQAPSCSETSSSSPVASRESIKSFIPDDIPTLGLDDHITSSPELRLPVGLNDRADDARVGAQTWTTAATNVQNEGVEPLGRSIVHDVTLQIPREYERDGYETPALSAMSNRSTRISEFDIVRPPTVEAPNQYGLYRAERRNQGRTSFYAPGPATQGDRHTAESNDSQESTENHRFVSVNNQEATQVAAGERKGAFEVCPYVAGGSHLSSQVSDLACRTSYIDRTTDNQENLSNSIPVHRVTVQRSTSDVTVPGIDVEPPSQSPTNTSPGTTVDPVLLTPEHANLMIVIPDPLQLPNSPSKPSEKSLLMPVVVEQLPPGFVPDLVTKTKHTRAAHRIISSPFETQFATTSSKVNLMPSGHGSLPFTAVPSEFPMEKSFGLEYSPAPLNRPISLFSDD